MKKVILGLIALLSFTACNKNGFDYNPQEAVTAKYNDAFIKTFGTPAANQDWGFGTTSYAMTRTANVNGNIWYKTWERPYNVNLSTDEINELKALLTKTSETYNTQIFPYEDYWVEQIYKGEAEDWAYDNNGNKTNTKIKGSSQMDHLKARNGSNYEHINNFNNGNNTTVMIDEKNSQKYVGITLMKDMSLDGITATNQFGYDESWGTENGKFYNNYLIIQYKGEWYVGFDFEAHKSTATKNNGEAMQVNRDWAFTDWIVRISPAVAKQAVRIICEDLNANNGSDFDFNDVVFDATYKNDGKTKITIRAAGGTLPLFVAGREVHELFGVSTSTMVNTNNGTVSKNPQSFTIDGDIAPWDIEVAVMKENELIPLKANVGEPTAKIAVSPNFIWCNEREDIRKRYPNFTEYVKNTSVNWY